jgi:hypothetical protein
MNTYPALSLIVNLAIAADIKISRLNSYFYGNNFALPPIAKRLAKITKTNVQLWMEKGKPEDRRKATEAWYEKARRQAVNAWAAKQETK